MFAPGCFRVWKSWPENNDSQGEVRVRQQRDYTLELVSYDHTLQPVEPEGFLQHG